ncbi:MAG: histidine--tRNA ligase [bacterium]
MSKLQPKLLQGTRDFLPEYMIGFQKVLDTFRGNAESFGFDPLCTPALEYCETLLAKLENQDTINELYRWEDKGGREIGLRFDHTVPLARVVSMNQRLPRPFKRYDIGPVWRFNRPQKGRYREFWQGDLDIVGCSDPTADAEVVAAVCRFFDRLGLTDYTVHLSDRRLLSGMAAYAGVDTGDAYALYRIIDQLDKIGWEGVSGLLQEKVGEQAAGKVRELLTAGADSLAEFQRARDLLSGCSAPQLQEAMAAVENLEAILEMLPRMGVKKEKLCPDLSLARGLDYYTGTILEVRMAGGAGSIAGGGRFDRLTETYGVVSPAVGVGVGFDRLMAVLEQEGLREDRKSVTEILVSVQSDELKVVSLEAAAALREAGCNTEIYLERGRLKKQLKYAANRGIAYVVIIGPQEYEAGEIIIKRMSDSEQLKFNNIDELINYVRGRA